MAETSKQPLVSIIMSMRNVSATVRDTIRSLQWQTLGDWELVLFDDGSTDDSIAIVESIADSRIRLQSDGQRKGWRRVSIRRWNWRVDVSLRAWMPMTSAFLTASRSKWRILRAIRMSILWRRAQWCFPAVI